ncbi:hypothetical protein BpHYR1_006569 [Brachionus plicatilis]|uniref:Uncharacterized protein n=1 Tax=Brachionus plicatilis TaxID=10195 RepID=A0A3M7QCF0_BRAPC|nr:hypothetical protein BpHYR1_006569 [Brachionus plicatilis]
MKIGFDSTHSGVTISNGAVYDERPTSPIRVKQTFTVDANLKFIIPVKIKLTGLVIPLVTTKWPSILRLAVHLAVCLLFGQPKLRSKFMAAVLTAKVAVRLGGLARATR